MELLHLHRPDGALLATFDLAALPSRPLTLGAGPADLALPEGPAILGALIRDEDGWILAAAEGGAETRLAPGEPAALGPFLFRLERDAAEARATLIWRVGKARACHAAPLGEGRNLLAWLPDRSALALNPAIPGDKRCDLFLDGDALTLVADDPSGGPARRLAFALGDRFALGDLQGLALGAHDAERALRTRDPLAWPDRRLRLGLCAAAGLGLLLLLALGGLAREARGLRGALAARAPAAVALPDLQPPPGDGFAADTVVAYGQLFHACLPGLLATPETSEAGDLLASRAAALLQSLPPGNEALRAPLRRKAAFLESLGAIKRALAAGDWAHLGGVLAEADAEALHYYDGDPLLGDARALDAFFGRDYPARCRALLAGSSPEGPEAALRGNRFLALPAVKARAERTRAHWRALAAWRDAVRGAGPDAAGGEGALRGALYALEGATAALGDPALDALLLAERQALGRELAARVAQGAGAAPAAVGRLRALARLARAVGTPDAREAARRAEAEADAIGAAYERRCRALVTDYRLSRLAGDAPAARAALDAILALGPADSPFWAWAQRERERAADTEGNPQP